MLKTPHFAARIAFLAVLLSASVFGEDRFLVTIQGDVTQVAQRHQLTVVRSFTGSATGTHVLAAPAGFDRTAVLRHLAADYLVTAAELDKLVELPGVASSVSTNPSVGNRALSALQLDGTPVYYFTSTAPAAYVNQAAGPIINLSRAHNMATGAKTKVAILDTGIDRTHPVLANSVGDGWDFLHSTSGGQEQMDLNQETTPILDQETTPILDQETTPILDGGTAVILKQETTPILDQETTPILDSKKYPAYGHGTMVAGLVHFVAPRALLMPVRVFAANGTATVSQVVQGILWAVDHGADVINMSFSTSQNSPALAAAVAYAQWKGVICVAAAGNDGLPTQVWPAAYRNVIGVASTDVFLIRSLFSNYGWPLVSLAAPGEGDITLYPGFHYAKVWGTSFSSPLVAGGAALLVDLRKNTDGDDAADALSHADYIGQQLGAGELDLYKACLAVKHGN